MTFLGTRLVPKIYMNTLDFITKARSKHGTRYEYSKTEYVNTKTKVAITCPEHGEFLQSPNNHLGGKGCPACAKSRNITPILLNRRAAASFVERATLKHSGKYDYSLVEYINTKSKVTIVCPTHGPFPQSPRDHLQGKGCTACARELLQETNQTKLAESASSFSVKAAELHSSKYEYSKVQYGANDRVKVTITCPTHGDFLQTPNRHLSGDGCPECGKLERLAVLQRMTPKDKSFGTKARHQAAKGSFAEKASALHGDKYDYSQVVYERTHSLVTIICPKHGSFQQTPATHLQGRGCYKCAGNSSKPEQEIKKYLEDLGVRVETRNRTVLAPLELDLYLPDHKVAIEYDGLYWHSDNFLSDNYHKDKTLRAKDLGIRLIHVFEDEWINRRGIVESVLAQKLGLTTRRFYARKCAVERLDAIESNAFLERNHLQGRDNAGVSYGLFFNRELLAVMTFARPSLSGGDRACEWSLSRFVVLAGVSVAGGFSKLFARFIRDYSPQSIQTFSDSRWSEGEVYLKNGFTLVRHTRPNYWYCKSSVPKRYHRFNFRKQLLEKKLEKYDASLTERENMSNNGWLRIYDVGNAVFVWSKPASLA